MTTPIAQGPVDVNVRGNQRDKVVCSEFRCAWHGLEDAILRAPNPFDEGETIYACPKCKEVNSVVVACDEPGCWKEATCGTSTPTTYRRTCGKHAPNAK